MAKVKDIKAVIHDMKFKYDWKIVIVLTLLVVTCGCASKRADGRIDKPGCYLDNMTVDKIGRELDNMAKGRKKFGTISLSEPILVESKKDQSGPFDFTLTTGPDNYYNDARNNVQGKMARSYQFVRDSGVGLSIQGDISSLAAYGVKLKQYEQEVAALDAQNKLRAQARDLEAQKVIAALPDNATEEQLLEAQARAAEIRAGKDTITLPEYPTSTQVQTSNNSTPPSSKEITEFLGLLEGTPDLKISNRSAINTAAGDTVTEAIFTLLGNPAKTSQFKDKLMLFGVSMVSITPGYVTKEGYTGELSVTCDYYYNKARRELLTKIKKVEENKEVEDKDEDLINLVKEALEATKTSGVTSPFQLKIPQRHTKEFRERYTPLAAAVSPMTDVDALDLSSSIRNQTFSAMKISAVLSYAGLGGQAEVFEKWAKKLEQDTQTRTSYAAITSFSDSGHFGFRIRPRLKAIKDGKTPGYELEDQSFPAVVIVGIDTDDLKLAFKYEGSKLVAYEPTIEFYQTVNWLPNKEVSLWDMVNGRHLWNKLWGNEPTESKRLEWLKSYNKVNNDLKNNQNIRGNENELAEAGWLNRQKNYDIKAQAMKNNQNITGRNSDFEKYVTNRVDLLRNQILGMYSSQYLPMEFLAGKPIKKKPTVNNPSKFFKSWYDAPSTYAIKGENFEGQVVGANIGGQPCKFEVVGDNTTLVTFPGLPDPSRAEAQADLKICQVNLNITQIQKRINEANTTLSINSKDPAVIEKKEKAKTDLTTAKSDMAIAKANKKVAEKEKVLAQTSILPPGSQLDIVLITRTKEGPIPAGTVKFIHNVTPKPSAGSKPKAPSSSKPKTDTTLTITRNAANKILTISSKGESEEVGKLIAIVKEGEKTGANVDLKLNASGQMDVKTDTNTK
ncbi:MAG: hypothetical protein HQ580_15270 [Planctomycetes bacterium]|nr:hypothetical protein [Planctomycetota bacterium]